MTSLNCAGDEEDELEEMLGELKDETVKTTGLAGIAGLEIERDELEEGKRIAVSFPTKGDDVTEDADDPEEDELDEEEAEEVAGDRRESCFELLGESKAAFSRSTADSTLSTSSSIIGAA